MHVTFKGETEYIIKNVWHASELPTNLLSVGKMTEKAVIIVFDNKGYQAYDKNNCAIKSFVHKYKG